MSEWISIDFAVPSDSREVLVRTSLKWTMIDGSERNSCTITIGRRIVFKNGRIKWRAQEGGYIIKGNSDRKITHWMPLPSPPIS